MTLIRFQTFLQLHNSIIIFYTSKRIQKREPISGSMNQTISPKQLAIQYLNKHRILQLFEELCSDLCYSQPPAENIQSYLIDQITLKQTQGFKTNVYNAQDVNNAFILYDLSRKGYLDAKNTITALRTLASNQKQYRDIKTAIIPEQVDINQFHLLYQKILIDHDQYFFSQEKAKRNSGVSTNSSFDFSTFQKSNEFDQIKEQLSKNTLASLIQNFNKINQNYHLVSQQCFNTVLQQITEHYINETIEQRYLLTLKKYFTLLKKQNEEKGITATIKIIRQIASAHLSLETQLFLKHLSTMKIADKVLNSKNTNDPKKIHLNSLSFDLENFNEILKVSNVVKECCNQDLDAFYFLSSYLQRCIKKASHTNSVIKIEQKIKQILGQLRRNHPPNQKTLQPRQELKFHKSFKNNQFKYQILEIKNIPLKQRNKRINDFIISFAYKAFENQQAFRSLTYKACLQNGGNQFKVSVKVDDVQDQSKIDRVKQKLFSKKFQKFKLVDGYHIQQFIDQQNKSYNQQINRIFENMEDNIEFTISDMLRGKCMFKNIEDINKAGQKILYLCKQYNYPIIQIDNRLLKNTTDLVIKFNINGVIAEFQLAYMFNVVSNQFNHKIYELARSNFFNSFTMIFNFNKKREFYISEFIQILGKMKEEEKTHIKSTQQLTEQYSQIQEFYQESRRWSAMSGTLNKKNKNSRNQQQINKLFLEIQNLIKNPQKAQYQRHLIYYLSANYFYSRCKYKQSDQMYQKWRSTQKQESFNQKNTESHKILGEMANVKFQLGYLDEAKQIQEIRLENIKKMEDNRELASQLQRLGQIYYKQGSYDIAEKFYEQCIQIKTTFLKQKSYGKVGVLNKLGNLYRKKGEDSKSLKCYQQSLQLTQTVTGKSGIKFALIKNDLGMLYESIGQYDKALQCYNYLLQASLKMKNGKGIIHKIQALDNIGSVYKRQKKYKQAMHSLTQSLQISQKIKGRDSIDVAKTLNRIGSVYYEQDDLINAMKYFEENMQIILKIKDDNCIDYAESLRNKGNVYKKQGKIKDALNCLHQCLTIQQKIKGRQSIDTAQTYINIGQVYLKKLKKDGNVEQGLKNFQLGLKIQQNIKGEGSIDKIQTLKMIGQVYFERKQFKKAYQLYTQAYLISRRFKSCQQESNKIMKRLDQVKLLTTQEQQKMQ